MFSRTSTFTSRLAGTITEYRLLSTRRPPLGHIHCRRTWLGDGSPVHGFQSSSLSIKNRRHSGACKIPSSTPDGFLVAVGRATGRERVQVAFQQSRGVRIQGRHRSDSDASHSAPSTRQDGAHNVNKQRKTMSDDLLTPAELAVMLGMSVRTLANWRSTGKGPPYLKIGVEPPEGHQDRRKVRYQRQVAEKWALAHRYRRTVAR